MRDSSYPLKQRGFSLLEIAISLVILAVASAAVYARFASNDERAQRRAFVDNSAALYVSGRELGIGPRRYAGFTAARLWKLAPSAWKDPSGSIIHEYDGPVIAWESTRFGTLNGSWYVVDFRGVPPAACIALANQIAASSVYFGVRTYPAYTNYYGIYDSRYHTQLIPSRVQAGCTGRGDSLSVYVYGK